MTIQLPKTPATLLARLAAGGFAAYAVGGCVRDALLGRVPHDWDICTAARPAEILRCFAGERVRETGRKHGTITVFWDGVPVEITTFRADGNYSDHRRPDAVRFVTDLTVDLARRDFTVNAMAADLTGSIVDPQGGRADLAAGLLRCVGSPDRRFQEDALRILRALRFAAVYDFTIAPATAAAIHRHGPLLAAIAAERRRAELERLLLGVAAGRLLAAFPDVLACACALPAPCATAWAQKTAAIARSAPALPVRLALLLGDLDADDAARTLERLRFDRKTVCAVRALVFDRDAALLPAAPCLRHWLHRLGAESLRHLLAVQRATAPDDPRIDATAHALDDLLASGACYTRAMLAVCGADLLALGVPQGAQVGALLDRLLDAVLDGTVENNRAALLARVCLQNNCPAP